MQNFVCMCILLRRGSSVFRFSVRKTKQVNVIMTGGKVDRFVLGYQGRHLRR